MVGSAIGDAFGAPVEFKSARDVRDLAGGDWVDSLLPYPEDYAANPWAAWEQAPPRGTGTDDTRNNQIFVECVIRNGGSVNSQMLAIEYIQRCRDRAAFYPRHQDLAERQYGWFYDQACAYLGMQESPTGPSLPALSISANDFPRLAGLISLALAGLLYIGEPEKAYMKTLELDFLDIGYARDATAMMAAMVSAALGGGLTGRQMIEAGLRTDPLGIGRTRSGDRIMSREISKFLRIADRAADEHCLIDELAREVAHRHPFDPIDVLGIPVAAIYYSDGDPVRSIAMSANDRCLDAEGNFASLRDVDCTAGVAGALVGALGGADRLPEEWVSDTIAANKDVYGIDLEDNARRFYEAVCRESER
jgi:ADP-ribosylglycohydrolase